MNNILVIGATSAIAQAFIEIMAIGDNKLFLVARDKEKLSAIKNDLRVRNNTNLTTFVLDVSFRDDYDSMFTAAKSYLGKIDIILIAHGTLPDQLECEANISKAIFEFEINTLSTIALCLQSAKIFEIQKSGLLAVITSVAGDRGRQSNYIYGSAKGAVNIFLQGLRNRLTKYGVSVLTVKPGFVDTPMTAHISKTPLFSSPKTVANGIVRAVNKNKSKGIYLPGYWRIIMLIVKAIPRRIFNKLSL